MPLLSNKHTFYCAIKTFGFQVNQNVKAGDDPALNQRFLMFYQWLVNDCRNGKRN